MKLRRTYKYSAGWNRVARGGYCYYGASDLRAANRNYYGPSSRGYYVGARLSKPIGGKDET
jgi:formylglycine-generating enzyme required for sulfatase activity